MQATNIICYECKRLRTHETGDTRYYCAAFPNGIPDDILLLGYDHRKPYKGDRGIHYQPPVEGYLLDYDAT